MSAASVGSTVIWTYRRGDLTAADVVRPGTGGYIAFAIFTACPDVERVRVRPIGGFDYAIATQPEAADRMARHEAINNSIPIPVSWQTEPWGPDCDRVSPAPVEYGVTCTRCGEHYPHAEIRPAFVCYGCRT